jgi:tRNA-modifying protein YgfZ
MTEEFQPLREQQQAEGAIWGTIADLSVPLSFGQDAAALQAVEQGVALCDRSYWGRIEVKDADRIRFLHNQSTNDFNCLKPGEGCDTVFVTSTGRTLDLATAYILDEAVLLLVSPNRRQKLMTWLDRFLFPADRVQLSDVTPATVTFSLLGPHSQSLLETLIGQPLPTAPYASHQRYDFAGITACIAVGSGLVTPGYTLITTVQQGARLWESLRNAGAVPMGDRLWETLRIQQGRPTPDQELTEDHNPLEAGLWHTISFSKGCYIGQETIARLNTYQGVKQQLWGIELPHPQEPGSVVMCGEDKIGQLTSITETHKGFFGLAYIRTKAGGAGLTVQIGETEGMVVEVPFLTRSPQ